MRKRRALKQDVWYEIRTRVNNEEPLFGPHRAREKALGVFNRVFRLSRVKYEFQFRRLRLSGDLLTFYIKPADGLQLPAIMQWLKQVFAVEFNKVDGRTGLGGIRARPRSGARGLPRGDRPRAGGRARGIAAGQARRGGWRPAKRGRGAARRAARGQTSPRVECTRRPRGRAGLPRGYRARAGSGA
jgi:hypothetical protein